MNAAEPGTPIGPGTEAGGGAFSRVIRMFHQPTAVFQELALTPTWLPPLIVILVFAIGAQLVIAPRIDMDATVRESLGERAEEMSDAQIDQTVAVGSKIGRISMFASPVAIPILYLLVSGVYFLGLKVTGSDTEYKSVFATVLHAILPPAVISSVLMTVIAFKKTGFTAMDLEGMVKSNLGAFLSPDAPKALAALAKLVDVFNVWQWVLLVIGLAIVGKVSRGKATGIVVVVWGGWAVIKVALAALR
jgi:hypothetical protein